MIIREPDFYREFHCVGGSCPLTCCRDWSIVPDEEALAGYRDAPAGLREYILENLAVDEDGDLCFRLTKDGRCALLDRDGLCRIQRQWGEEHLCAHCAAYPRFNEEYGCLTENSLAVSCPEAARLTMQRGIFPLAETDDGVDDPPFDGVDKAVLDGLVATRKEAFALLQEEDRSLWDRLDSLLEYAAALEGRNISRLAPAALLELLAGLDPLCPDWPALLRRRAEALAALSLSEYSTLTKKYASARPDWELHLTRLAEVLLFRHWPKAVNDDLLLGRAAFAGAACVALHHLSLLEWREDPDFSDGGECLLWARFSREVEHDEDNFFTLIQALCA